MIIQRVINKIHLLTRRISCFMRKIFLLSAFVICFSAAGEYLKNEFDREEIVRNMREAALFLDRDFSEKIAKIKNMRGEKTTYNNHIPSLYTIKDGTFLVKHSYEDSFSCLTTQEQSESDEKWFVPSSVRDYRLPFVQGKGKIMKKDIDTQDSIYFLRFRKELPSYIFASGNSQVVFLGNCPAGKVCEIWLEDDAQLVVENFISSGQLIVHARDRSRVVFKKGKSENVYVSSRGKNVIVDLAGLASKSVVINLSNGDIGIVKVNPIEKYFKIGQTVEGSLQSETAIEPVELNSTAYKAKRFFLKSIPNNTKRAVSGVIVAGGGAVVIGAIVASAMYGIFPAVIGFKVAASALMSSTVFYSVAIRIRRVMKNINPENFVKTSI